MNRREFTKGLGLAAISTRTWAQTADSASTPTLYYVDGYHGGSRGHMPAGSWRDILNALRSIPQWKLSFDIEPASWDDLRREDPEAYEEWRKLFEDQSVDSRLEICNGTFAQPFGWAQGGESNIRQLVHGRDVILRHFPRALIQTYAVQEPCWSSCLPQVLRSLGFTAAVLKNPGTAWGGYSAGFDAETVEWVGPDGTAIPAVPRYACENLQKVWETESVTGSAEFSRKCAAHGIAHPAGNCFQDLGWAAKPKVSASHIRYVTWREYMNKVAAKPQKQWRFTAEDILTALPWGEKTIQTVAQQVRSAENRVVMAEKLASMASALHGTEFPEERLRRAWDQLLWSQHHDAWITATTRSGRQAWAFQVAAETMESEEISNDAIGRSAEVLSRAEARPPAVPLGPQWVRVLNTSASEREAPVELNWGADVGTRHARMFNAEGGEIPCQFLRVRKFAARGTPSEAGRAITAANAVAGVPAYAPGESLNDALILFPAKTPSMGYSSYRIEPVYDERPVTAFNGAVARNEPDGAVVLETDLYRLRIDPAQGGVITSLLAKDGNHEFVDSASERRFNEYRGYFITEKKWASSADSRATVSITERGPVRVRAQISGQILGRRFQTTITLAQGQRRIDFAARFTYDQDTWIGDPWDIKPEDRRIERRRSSNNGRWKLQAIFPAPFTNRVIHKNAAYDVCRSRNASTDFQGWDEIKHNIVVNWMDVMDEQKNLGLAVLSDHTTGYTHAPDHPLSLVMGWGWEGGYWWGKCPLRGTQQVNYALVPHTGAWDRARVSQESTSWNEPLVALLMQGDLGKAPSSRSLVNIEGDAFEVPTMLFQGRGMLVRLFNGEGDATERTVSFAVRPTQVELVELDGRLVRRLDVRRAANGRYEVKLGMPRFGIRTLRCELARAAG